MHLFMTRNFDHAGYYETRLVLALAVLAFVVWKARGRDYRFLAAFLWGSLFQGVMETLLEMAGLRSGHYSLSFFGAELTGVAAHLLQGVLEGGPLTVFGFWFAANVTSGAFKAQRSLYAAGLAGAVVLSVIVASLAQGAPITSARPMFDWNATSMLYLVVPPLLAFAANGWRGLRDLGLFGAGVVIYSLCVFEPLHAGMARYVAEGASQAGPFIAAPPVTQVLAMWASYVIEVAGMKQHHFLFPYLLGQLALTPRRPFWSPGSGLA